MAYRAVQIKYVSDLDTPERKRKVAELYNHEDKRTTNLTFTLNYADGEKLLVEEGILLSVKDNVVDIHIGTSNVAALLAAAECMYTFILDMGLGDALAYCMEKALEERYGTKPPCQS